MCVTVGGVCLMNSISKAYDYVHVYACVCAYVCVCMCYVQLYLDTALFYDTFYQIIFLSCCHAMI